jgi:hypothetical protein
MRSYKILFCLIFSIINIDAYRFIHSFHPNKRLSTCFSNSNLISELQIEQPTPSTRLKLVVTGESVLSALFRSGM